MYTVFVCIVRSRQRPITKQIKRVQELEASQLRTALKSAELQAKQAEAKSAALEGVHEKALAAAKAEVEKAKGKATEAMRSAAIA
eukprot:COSAG06_NODE_52_length_28059_cov_48.831378_2_plen_85_part_00